MRPISFSRSTGTAPLVRLACTGMLSGRGFSITISKWWIPMGNNLFAWAERNHYPQLVVGKSVIRAGQQSWEKFTAHANSDYQDLASKRIEQWNELAGAVPATSKELAGQEA